MEDIKVDPVSGNEIPTGATATEVRDDIDVKMSEGEYVVPSHVVRFYGIDRFEKMKQKAEEGWDKMESSGRIGGDTGPSEDPEALSEEDIALLEETMGMASGGLVKAKAGYADGGWNPGPPPEGLEFLAGESPSATGATEVENKTYYGPLGETRLIMFVNGVPITKIPEGYAEKEEAGSTPEVETPREPDDAGGLRDEVLDEDRDTFGKDYTDMSPTDIKADVEKGLAIGDKLEGFIGKTLGGMVAGPLGGLVGSKAAQGYLGFGVQNAINGIVALEEQGEDATALYDALTAKSQFKSQEDIRASNKYQKALNEAKAKRSSLTEAIVAGAGSSNAMGSEGTDDLSGDFNGVEGSSSGGSSSPSSSSAGSRGVGSEVSAPTAASKGRAEAAVSGSVSASTAAGLSGSQSTNPGGFDNEEGSWGSGPMNKGGLVTRKRKTSPKKPRASKRKGLASKK